MNNFGFSQSFNYFRSRTNNTTIIRFCFKKIAHYLIKIWFHAIVIVMQMDKFRLGVFDAMIGCGRDTRAFTSVQQCDIKTQTCSIVGDILNILLMTCIVDNNPLKIFHALL